MSHFKTPIGAYSRGPLISVRVTTPVAAVLDTLEERNVSAVAVLDPQDALVGVISRTDLLRIGTPKKREGSGGRKALVELPDKVAGEVMHPGVLTLPRETPVATAAKRMVDERIHRFFVTAERPEEMQVFSTREILTAIWEARVLTPIGSVMSRKAFTIGHDATLAAATERLDQAHAQGIVVLDPEGWPIGLFTQREALQARNLAPSAIVEEAMSHGMLCLNRRTPLYLAAAQAAQTRARRVLVIDEQQVTGVLIGLDFARLAHGS